MKVAIIGGGPAGMMCAIKAAENHQVTIFEKTKNWAKNYLLRAREDAISQIIATRENF